MLKKLCRSYTDTSAKTDFYSIFFWSEKIGWDNPLQNELKMLTLSWELIFHKHIWELVSIIIFSCFFN